MQKTAFRRLGGISVLKLFGAFCLLPAIGAHGQVVAWGMNNYGQTNVPASASNVTTIAAGGYHNLALQPNGTVLAWGYDDAGQIDVPAGLSNVVAVAAGASHSLALQSNGTVVAWGWDGYNQTNVPAGLSNVLAISGGWQSSLALKSDGTVVAWGNPSGGGPGSVVPTNLNNVTAIASSYHQDMALMADGTVAAWGGDPTLGSVPTGLSNAIAVAATFDADLVLESNGTLVAWGNGSLTSGVTLGGVTLPPMNTANLPQGLTNVVAISGGYFNFIALEANGTVVVWGDNTFGETNVPPGLTNAGAIGTGLCDCLALTGTGSPQIVQPPFNASALAGSPVLFVGSASGQAPMSYQWEFNNTNIPGATAASLLLTNLQMQQAGQYSFVASNASGVVQSPAATLTIVPLILTAQPTNQVLYFGDSLSVGVQGSGPWTYQWQLDGTNLLDATNSTLTLNQGLTNQPGAYSVIVSNPYGSVTNFALVSSVFNSTPFIVGQPVSQATWPGQTATFQVSANGSKPLSYQWLFNGTNISSGTNATLVLTNLTAANMGNYSVLVSNPVGSTSSSNAWLSILDVVTWGQTNYFGLNVVPLDLTNATAIAGGYAHSVALKSNGKVAVWGDNSHGQTNVPANVSNVVAIAAAYYHTLALKTNGTVVSWGDMTTVPANVTNVIAIAAGDAHSLALRADGSVVAWGSGTATNVPASLTNVLAIAAGNNFSVALKPDKTLAAWGSAPSTNRMTNVESFEADESQLAALRADWTLVAAGGMSPSTVLSNVVAVAAGINYYLALRPDGTVTNFAAGGYGFTTPAGLTNVAVLASGQYHALAILGNGPQPAPMAISNLNWLSNSFSLFLPSQYGHLYWLEYKDSLADANWKTLPLNLSTGATLNVTDNSATNAARFYRVRQW